MIPKNMLTQIPTAALSHTVVPLSVHEEDKEVIVWTGGKEYEKHRTLLEGENNTPLTAFFKLCNEDDEAAKLTYPEVNTYYM